MRSLRKWRLARPYTQRELASIASVHWNTISTLERGLRVRGGVRPYTMRAVAAALGCSPYDIAEFQLSLNAGEA